MDKNNSTIFISYSHKDKNVADSIVQNLEGSGLNCWYAPRNIVPGKEWADAIINAIKKSSIMVLVFTDYSNASKQVAREVETAINNNVIIIPFKLTEATPSGALEYYLATLHWLDANGQPIEESVNRLNQMIQGILEGKEAKNTKHNTTVKKIKERKTKYLIMAACIAILCLLGFVILPLLRKGVTDPANNYEEKEPALDLTLARQEDCLNNLSSSGAFIVADSNNEYLYFIENRPGIYKSKYKDFINNYETEDLELSDNAQYLAYSNDHIIYNNYDYLCTYDLKTKEIKELGCLNSGYYLGVGDWILYVDLNDYTLHRISLDGKYSHAFEGVSISEEYPKYMVYNGSIYFIDNNNNLRVLDSDGSISEVKYTIAYESNSRNFVIKARDFCIIEDLLLYIDPMSKDLCALNILDNTKQTTLVYFSTETYPIQLKANKNNIYFINGTKESEDSDWVFSLYKVLINDNKQVELSSIEAPEIENIWLANMVGDYFYYRSAYENEDGTITYKYNCFAD